MGCNPSHTPALVNSSKSNKSSRPTDVSSSEPPSPVNLLPKRKSIDTRKMSSRVTDQITQNIFVLIQGLTENDTLSGYKILAKHPLFQGLSQIELLSICSEMVPAKAIEGQYLFRQGDKGNCFFLIVQGVFDVQVNNEMVTQLKQGDSFGELALLFKANRMASIKCTSARNRLLVMKPLLFHRTLQTIKMKQYDSCFKLVESVQMFQLLTNKQKVLLANAIDFRPFPAKSTIFEAKEEANNFYIIQSGEVSISLNGIPDVHLKQFESFGESAFRKNGRRQGKAITTTGCVLGTMTREVIQTILGSNSSILLYFNTKKWALQSVEAFKKIQSQTLSQLIMHSVIHESLAGQTLFSGIPKAFYMPLDGLINDCKPGSILCAEHYAGSMEPVKLVKMVEGNYSTLEFEKVNLILNAETQKRTLQEKASRRQSINKENLAPVNLASFQYLKRLGEGQFGQVFLVRNPSMGNSTLFALKCLNKAKIKEEGMEQFVVQQKKILQKIAFPLIMGYVKSFADNRHVYILIEHINGIEMFDVIRQFKIVPKEVARFFFGSLLLAVEHLHERKIIYRDTKPENSLVDYEGRVFLIDMGTAKLLEKEKGFKTFTIIGTPHYMAPEVFEGRGYSYQVDLWSLGVLLYEFTCGALPFGENLDSEDPSALYSLIKRSKVTFPTFVNDPNLKQVLLALLSKNSQQRAISAEISALKKMPYFDGFDWADVASGKAKPPYVPKAFRNKDKDTFRKIEGVPMLNQLYPGEKVTSYLSTITEWTTDYL